MKIGSRVRLSNLAIANNVCPILRKRYGILSGVILDFRRDGLCANVMFDQTKTIHGLHIDFLTEEASEPFPYRSHRTMAQVDADEQEPQPA